MNALAVVEDRRELPALAMLIDDAARTLTGAKSAAQVLEARDKAAAAYDQAKRAGRLAAARSAHDEIVARIHRAQAQALEIEAGAKRRLADEYDAAQERGDVAGPRDGKLGRSQSERPKPATAELGLSRKQIHEAREIRDAEETDPGIVHRTLHEAADAGEEPTKAKLRRAVKEKSKRKRAPKRPANAGPVDTQHDRDLKMLISIWGAACESARGAFLEFLKEGQS